MIVLAPELPIPRDPCEPRPRGFVYMRLFGLTLMVAYVGGTVVADPGPGLHGRGPLVALCVVALVAGLFVGSRQFVLPTGVRLAALVVVLLASFGLIALQGDQSAAIAGIYFASVLAALRLPGGQARFIVVLAVVGGSLTYALSVGDATGQIITIVTGVPPWFFVIRVMRELRERQAATLELVEELRESREAQAAAAADAERARVARDMHDVLAHSLSGLAIQLELARCSRTGAARTPSVTGAVDRATAWRPRAWTRRGGRSARCAARSCRAPSACRRWPAPSSSRGPRAASCT